MKKTLMFMGLLIPSLGATTITLTGPADFLFTDNTGAPLTFRNVQVGRILANTFVQFAPLDASQPSIGLSSGALAGRFIGNASDNSAAADAFNGSQIFISILADDGGVAVVGASGVNFPTNNSGVGDSFSFSSATIDTVSDLSTSPVTINANGITIGVIPEPSVALLGGLALFGGLIRRRR